MAYYLEKIPSTARSIKSNNTNAYPNFGVGSWSRAGSGVGVSGPFPLMDNDFCRFVKESTYISSPIPGIKAATGCNAKKGFIVNVTRVPPGGYLVIDDGQIGSGIKITEPGRYAGYYVSPNGGDGSVYVWGQGSVLSYDNYIELTELLIWDYDTYPNYQDFLQSPVDTIVSERITDINQVPMTNPRLGFAASIPTTGLWRAGDRLENLSWDGNFSTPIAWVCTAGGNPGTWKAVTQFDAYNSTQDPLLYSFIGASGRWEQTQATASIANSKLTLLAPRSGAAAARTPVASIVPYEIINYNVVVDSIDVNNPFLGFGDSNLDASRRVTLNLGTNSGDFTLPSTIPDGAYVYVKYLADAVQDRSAVFSRVRVTPKYPFLSNVPSSFTAAPTNIQARGFPRFIDTWTNIDPLNPLTYSNGNLIFSATNAGMMLALSNPLVIGKTYRLRINVTTAGTGAYVIFRNYANANPVVQATIAASVGMQEITLVAQANSVQVEIYSNTTGLQFNYLRLYAE